VQVFPVPNLSGSRLTGICIEQRRVLVARFGTVIPSFADYRHTSKVVFAELSACEDELPGEDTSYH